MAQPVVFRRKLKEQVQAALENGRAVLFSAPCGFGKTTTIRAILAGNRMIEVSAGSPDFQLPDVSDRWNLLVVDDLQELTDEKLQRALCEMIRENPRRRFVFLSRGIVPGWLVPFEIVGMLAVFRAQDLLLDRESVGQLLEAYGVSVPDVMLTSIYRQSAGYPLAISLLARRMMRGDAYGKAVSNQVRQEIFLYYEEAVFRRLELPVRRLLMELAPFECITTELARIVSGSSRAGEILLQLQRTTTMMHQKGLDCWYFWPLFRQFLLWELEQNYSEEQRRNLYGRGGLYYELREEYGRALECYSRIRDYSKVSQLLVKNAEMHPGMGHYCDMEPYYRALPEREILSSPALMQAMSMLCALCMDYEQSEVWYRKLAEFEKSRQPGDADARDARGRLAWLDISLPQRKVENSIEMFPKLFRQLAAREIRLPPFSVTDALPSLLNGGKDYSPWGKDSERLYTIMRAPVEAVLGRDGVCMLDCAAAENEFEKGEDIRDRIVWILQNIDRIRRDGTPDIEFGAVGLLARMQMDSGHSADARSSLENLRERFEACGKTRFLPNLDAMICRANLRMDNDEAVDEWYRERAPRKPQQFWTMKRYQYFTQAMVELAFGDEETALLTLAPLEPYCKICSRYIDSIYLDVLSSIAFCRLGDKRWRQKLCDALDIAVSFGFFRPVAQYGAAILPLLESCGWDGDAAFLEKLTRLTRQQAALYPDYLQPRKAMTAPLSAMELQVLQLLCANKSNAEIGRILDIKLPTVKTHVSHILGKLGVKRRSEVKAAAQRLHLIH